MLQEIVILKSMPLFSNLTSEELEKVAGLLHPVNVSKGQVITEEDALAKNFFIVLSGKYKLSSRRGHEFILRNPGDFIGWATIIAAPKYMGTCVALSSGEVLRLSKQDFMRLLLSDADLGNKIMKKGSELAIAVEPHRKKSGS